VTEEKHTIPVPEGWSPEIAWEHIKNNQLIPEGKVMWYNVIIRDGKFHGVMKDKDD
jgi:hypothetical protein